MAGVGFMVLDSFLPVAGNGNFGATWIDSLRSASGSGPSRGKYSNCLLRYAFVGGNFCCCLTVTSGVRRNSEETWKFGLAGMWEGSFTGAWKRLMNRERAVLKTAQHKPLRDGTEEMQEH